jgi:hypothetical protein
MKRITAEGASATLLGPLFRQRACLLYEHDGDAIAYRKCKAISAADHFSVLAIMFKAALADWAHEDVEKARFHAVNIKTDSWFRAERKAMIFGSKTSARASGA